VSQGRAALTLLGAAIISVIRAGVPTQEPLECCLDGVSDVSISKTMLSRLNAGESHYEALGDELRRRGGHTRSVFNWRTPLLHGALARVAVRGSRAVLAVLGLFLIVATLRITAYQPLRVPGSDILPTGAAEAVVMDGAVVMGDVWAGLLTGLFACMLARQRRSVAIALGLIALFLREPVYVGFFPAAGQPFNDNRGLVAWPAWAVASGYGLQAAVDAVRKLLVWKHTPLGTL
jgi:hypothetical protein